MKTLKNSTISWCVALSLAAMQVSVAIFAVYASDQNPLSGGACIGGYFGSLASLFVLVVGLIWAIIFAVKSRKMATWHGGLKPLGAVALSSTMAIFIRLNAVLRCTV